MKWFEILRTVSCLAAEFRERLLYFLTVTVFADRIFINVCTIVRKVYIIIANGLKCVFLLSQVASGPEESLIKYSKFKSKSARHLHINKAALD